MKSYHRLWLLPLFVSMTLPLACGDDDDNGAMETSDGAAVEQALSENEAVAAMSAVNAAEVQQGQFALQNATDQRARDFAQRMVDEHTQAQAQLDAIIATLGITPEESVVSQQVVQEAQGVMLQLQSAAAAGTIDTIATTGPNTPIVPGSVGGPSSFDVTYMDSQVEMHAQVLDLLDTQLVPAAVSPALVDYFAAVRSVVSQHLTDATALSQTLAAEARSDGAAPVGTVGGTASPDADL